MVSATVTVHPLAVSEIDEKPSLEQTTPTGLGLLSVAVGPKPLPVSVTSSPPETYSEDGEIPVTAGAT